MHAAVGVDGTIRYARTQLRNCRGVNSMRIHLIGTSTSWPLALGDALGAAPMVLHDDPADLMHELQAGDLVLAGWPLSPTLRAALRDVERRSPDVRVVVSLPAEAERVAWQEAAALSGADPVSRDAGKAELAYRLGRTPKPGRTEPGLTRARIASVALFDAETGLYNRRYLLARLREQLAGARRYGRPLSLVLLRVEGLGAQLDRLSSSVVASITEELADLLAADLRDADVVARIGRDVFAWLLPETERDGALAAAERLRSTLGASLHGRGLPLAVHIGHAGVADDPTSPGRLLELAEQRLLK